MESLIENKQSNWTLTLQKNLNFSITIEMTMRKNSVRFKKKSSRLGMSFRPCISKWSILKNKKMESLRDNIFNLNLNEINSEKTWFSLTFSTRELTIRSCDKNYSDNKNKEKKSNKSFSKDKKSENFKTNRDKNAGNNRTRSIQRSIIKNFKLYWNKFKAKS
mgnify:CR=1 FL=1